MTPRKIKTVLVLCGSFEMWKNGSTCLNQVLLQWTLEELAGLTWEEMFMLLNLPIKIIIRHALCMKILDTNRVKDDFKSVGADSEQECLYYFLTEQNKKSLLSFSCL